MAGAANTSGLSRLCGASGAAPTDICVKTNLPQMGVLVELSALFFEP
jgi:hypothetical protein